MPGDHSISIITQLLLLKLAWIIYLHRTENFTTTLKPSNLADYDCFIMTALAWYPLDMPAAVPEVDHMHERSHQHQTFLRYITRKQPDSKLIPNYPDVDIRDAITHYLVEVEVPGVKDVNNIKCQWTSSTTMIVSGENTRPGESVGVEADNRSTHHEPYIIIGERKIGGFRRHLSFAANVDPDKMTAKLEAGVLCLNISKKSTHVPKGDGSVKIEAGDD